MVEASSPSSLLAKLQKKLTSKPDSISADDFLQILNNTVDQKVRSQVYDILEGLSKCCDWKTKKQEILTAIQVDTPDQGTLYLKNQLQTVDCLRSAEKHKLNKPLLVEVEHVDDLKDIKIEKKNTKCYVVDQDIIDKTLELYVAKQEDTAMIIMGASEYRQSHKLGSVFAQMGAICRRTNFPAIVTKEALKKNTVVYYPELYVFSQNDGQEYDSRYKIKALQIWSQGDDGNGNLDVNQIGDNITNLMRHFFRLALKKGINNLVLTALGCGYKNQDPANVAKCLDTLIKEEFDGAFERIIFAIKQFNEKSVNNYEEFKKVFSDQPEGMPAPTVKRKIARFAEEKTEGSNTIKKKL